MSHASWRVVASTANDATCLLYATNLHKKISFRWPPFSFTTHLHQFTHVASRWLSSLPMTIWGAFHLQWGVDHQTGGIFSDESKKIHRLLESFLLWSCLEIYIKNLYESLICIYIYQEVPAVIASFCDIYIYDIYTYLVWFGMIHPSNSLTLQYPKGPVVRLRHITTAWPLKWLMLLAVARPTQTAIRDIGTALQMDMDNISNICTYMKKKAGLQCLERTFETTCWYILKMDRAS